MDELLVKHRKEQRDLVARITQKKKSATKKTRKGINDECTALELELKERHARELAELSGVPQGEGEGEKEVEKEVADDGPADADSKEVEDGIEKLAISNDQSSESIEQLDHPTTIAHASGQSKSRKPNRQKARLARRAAEQEALAAQAAEEAANLPDLREMERSKMSSHLTQHGLQEKEIRADGHCLYSAVADQMEQLGFGLTPIIQPKIIADPVKNKDSPTYKTVRHAAADFIAAHPDDFVPFLEEPLEQYLHKIRDTGEWGGHMELLALANTYGVIINVLHGDGRVDKIESPKSDQNKTIWLGYYQHGFGLGEHYNSLRKKS